MSNQRNFWHCSKSYLNLLWKFLTKSRKIDNKIFNWKNIERKKCLTKYLFVLLNFSSSKFGMRKKKTTVWPKICLIIVSEFFHWKFTQIFTIFHFWRLFLRFFYSLNSIKKIVCYCNKFYIYLIRKFWENFL